jgi:hypothetical protein
VGGSVLEFRVLGPVQAVRDGRELALGGPRRRAVLALLLVAGGRVVPAERLADELWQGSTPPGAAGTLRSHRVVLAADATGSRNPADRVAAIDRARQHGAEIVTSEMVLFEWLRDAQHPNFREVQKLLK